jgi:hypothetical protein
VGCGSAVAAAWGLIYIVMIGFTSFTYLTWSQIRLFHIISIYAWPFSIGSDCWRAPADIWPCVHALWPQRACWANMPVEICGSRTMSHQHWWSRETFKSLQANAANGHSKRL